MDQDIDFQREVVTQYRRLRSKSRAIDFCVGLGCPKQRSEVYLDTFLRESRRRGRRSGLVHLGLGLALFPPLLVLLGTHVTYLLFASGSLMALGLAQVIVGFELEIEGLIDWLIPKE